MKSSPLDTKAQIVAKDRWTNMFNIFNNIANLSLMLASTLLKWRIQPPYGWPGLAEIVKEMNVKRLNSQK